LGDARCEDNVIMTSWHSFVSYCLSGDFVRRFFLLFLCMVSTNLFKLAQVMQHKVNIADISSSFEQCRCLCHCLICKTGVELLHMATIFASSRRNTNDRPVDTIGRSWGFCRPPPTSRLATTAQWILHGAQVSFPVRKRTGTLRIWRARERERIWVSGAVPPAGSRGRAPGQGGKAALQLKVFYCRREQICHSHLSET